MAKAKAKVVTKIKKKFWFPIVAPKIFNNAQLGEIYLDEADKAAGRTFWHPLKEISGSMRDQHVYLNFKIKKSPGNNLMTEIVGYRLTPNSIKRMVRRHHDRIDDSFVLETSDSKKIRIKTLILTAYKTKNSVDTRLKKEMKKKLEEDIKKINFGNLIDKLISSKIQIETKKFLTKIYPVKMFSVRYVGFEEEKGEETSEETLEDVQEEVESEEPKKTEKAEEKPKEKNQEKEEKPEKKTETKKEVKEKTEEKPDKKEEPKKEEVKETKEKKETEEKKE